MTPSPHPTDPVSASTNDIGPPLVSHATSPPVPASSADNTDKTVESQLETIEHMVEQGLNEGSDQAPESPTSTAKRVEKLIIQVPCYNEEKTLGITLSALPRHLQGVEKVEWLIIDDGSQDKTVEVAQQYGVDHIVKLPKNQGLAKAFMSGLQEALRCGADIIVNTDADNQYCAEDIQKLVDPILQGKAEFVVGERPIFSTPHFSFIKKVLQKFGSWVVRQVSQANVADAPSGFRAMSRETAMQLNVFNEYTYTLETLIQAGQKNMAVLSVPIRTNPDLRPSRLLKSIPSYISRSAGTITRIFMTYRPLHFFSVPGSALCLTSLILCGRYMYFFINGAGKGHVHSLILAAILMGAGLLAIVVGLVGDLISVNRKLLEKIDWRVQCLEESIKEIGPSEHQVNE